MSLNSSEQATLKRLMGEVSRHEQQIVGLEGKIAKENQEIAKKNAKISVLNKKT